MDFNDEHKVIIDSMDKVEARAFILFLQSEVKRHEIDIDNAFSLITYFTEKFGVKASGV